MFLFRLISFTLLLFSFAVSSAYSSPKELKAELIESWISSQKKFEEWGEKNEKRLINSEDSTVKDANPLELSIESMIKPLKEAGLLDSANNLAKKSGFDSIHHWAETTLRITKTAAAIEFESHPEMNDLSELEKLMNTPDMNKTQKEMLMNAIEKNKSIVKELTEGVSEFDKNIVKPFLTRIHKMIDPAN